jgi:hypothetical protein
MGVSQTGEWDGGHRIQATRPRRFLRGCAAVLLGFHASVLFLAIPVLVLMLLGSLWEGGDEGLKHRLLAWGPVSGLGNVVVGVLLISAAVAVLRDSPERRSLLTICAGALIALGAGWAWVYQDLLLTDPSTLGDWALLTLPGMVAVPLALAAVVEDSKS